MEETGEFRDGIYFVLAPAPGTAAGKAQFIVRLTEHKFGLRAELLATITGEELSTEKEARDDAMDAARRWLDEHRPTNG